MHQLSAGVKQLAKKIVASQFRTACITTQQAMHCIIEVTLHEMHGFVLIS